MTATEALYWFRGFCEALDPDALPNEKQWEEIQLTLLAPLMPTGSRFVLLKPPKD